jgi:hypothetical protein
VSLEGFVAEFAAAMESLGYGVAAEKRLTTEEKSELAMERAGTRDKGSRAYKSARRSIERRATEAGQTRGQPNVRFAREVYRRGLRVQFSGEIDPSPEDEEGEGDMREREFELVLAGDELESTVEHLAAGNLSAAGHAFKRELLAAYAEQGGTDERLLAGAAMGEINALSISWGDE